MSANCGRRNGFYSMGPHTLTVPNELFALNRRRLCTRLRDDVRVKSNAWVLLQGGSCQNLYDTDVEYVFRQEQFFFWAFGVHEDGCFGAIRVSSGDAYLFIPKQSEELQMWIGKLPTLNEFRQHYNVTDVYYVDKIFGWLLVFGLTTECVTVSNTSPYPPTAFVPRLKLPESHYRFHYMVKSEKTDDFKVQEEYRNGDSVVGTYKVGELNENPRVVNYAMDINSDIRTNADMKPGTSPVKLAATNFEGLGHYSSYRAGTSHPLKNRKPVRGFNPIVVKSMALQPVQSLQSQLSETSTPYQFYKELVGNSTANYMVSSISPPASTLEGSAQNMILKSIIDLQAEGNKSTAIPLVGENKSYNLQSLSFLNIEPVSVTNPSTIPTEIPLSSQSTFIPIRNMYQLNNADIPSSIMEILNQRKSQTVAKSDNTPSQTPRIVSAAKMDLPEDYGLPSTKDSLPQRPMRLIGLNPVFLDNIHLQNLAENFTSIPQLYVEALSNIQYAAPIPLQYGPLTSSPEGPFHNVPRSVNDVNPETPFVNAVPILNLIPISSPFFAPSFGGDAKAESKLENKGMQSPVPVCSDCLMPANYIPYPVIKTGVIPATTPASPLPAGIVNQKPLCNNPTLGTAPLWPSYPPTGIAYILMPTPLIKNNKFNETRPIVVGGIF